MCVCVRLGGCVLTVNTVSLCVLHTYVWERKVIRKWKGWRCNGSATGKFMASPLGSVKLHGTFCEWVRDQEIHSLHNWEFGLMVAPQERSPKSNGFSSSRKQKHAQAISLTDLSVTDKQTQGGNRRLTFTPRQRQLLSTYCAVSAFPLDAAGNVSDSLRVSLDMLRQRQARSLLVILKATRKNLLWVLVVY